MYGRILYFAVIQPIKYSPRYILAQIAIQLRTWGKETHVGMMYHPEEFSELFDFIKVRALHSNTIIKSEILKPEYHKARQMVSATWPHFEVEDLFIRYTNYRVLIKSIQVSEYQYKKIMDYWNTGLQQKRGYSIIGLFWFLIGPIIDLFRKSDTGRDADPNRAFCSEATTNCLLKAGIPVFYFTHTRKEHKVYKARSMPLAEYLNLGGLSEFWEYANTTKDYYFGYKVSPKVFNMSPILRDEIILDIYKDKVVIRDKPYLNFIKVGGR